MGRRNDLRVERLAERVVRHEEEALGRSVHKLSKIDERRYGCDLRSVDPDGTEHLIEIKGWGESLLDANGRFRYSTELRTAQWKASIAPGWALGDRRQPHSSMEGRRAARAAHVDRRRH
jgi:hypothetical protein